MFSINLVNSTNVRLFFLWREYIFQATCTARTCSWTDSCSGLQFANTGYTVNPLVLSICNAGLILDGGRRVSQKDPDVSRYR